MVPIITIAVPAHRADNLAFAVIILLVAYVLGKDAHGPEFKEHI